MNRGFAISAPRSGSGKTLLTMALMNHFHRRIEPVQPFKIGPDYIDPQFHRAITGVPSVNLDTYLMNSDQVRYLFRHYSENRMAILEGVMGFFDGMERESSTYDVTRILELPVILVLPANGISRTLSALLLGLLSYREDHTIKGVILNHVGSESHYKLLYDSLKSDFPRIHVAGWIPANLQGLSSRHLGLHTMDMDKEKIRELSEGLLKHVDLDLVAEIAEHLERTDDQDASPRDVSSIVNRKGSDYPFPTLNEEEVRKLRNQKLAIVMDRAFSFLYTDNIEFLKGLFGSVTFVSAMEDGKIPEDTDIVYLPGGYVETPDIYPALNRAVNFRESLRAHVNRGKRVYGECAGLLYLGRTVFSEANEALEMSGILPLDFRMRKKRKRLGYYESDNLRGHSFHYSEPILPTEIPPSDILVKPGADHGEPGTWEMGSVRGTYLHTMFRNQPEVIRRFFLD